MPFCCLYLNPHLNTFHSIWVSKTFRYVGIRHVYLTQYQRTYPISLKIIILPRYSYLAGIITGWENPSIPKFLFGSIPSYLITIIDTRVTLPRYEGIWTVYEPDRYPKIKKIPKYPKRTCVTKKGKILILDNRVMIKFNQNKYTKGDKGIYTCHNKRLQQQQHP